MDHGSTGRKPAASCAPGCPSARACSAHSCPRGCGGAAEGASARPWDAADMTAAPDHDAPDYNALLRELRQARHISQCRPVALERPQLELAAPRARTAASASQQEAAGQHVVTLEQALLRL